MDGQGTTWRGNITENFNRLSRARKRYRRQTTERLAMANVNVSSRSLKRRFRVFRLSIFASPPFPVSPFLVSRFQFRRYIPVII